MFRLKIGLFIVFLTAGCRSCDNTQQPGQATPPPANTSSPGVVSVSYCLCACRADGIAGNICNHFTKEQTANGAEFVCDDDYLVKTTAGSCEAYPETTPDDTSCSGYHPVTKASGTKGKLAACVPK